MINNHTMQNHVGHLFGVWGLIQRNCFLNLIDCTCVMEAQSMESFVIFGLSHSAGTVWRECLSSPHQCSHHWSYSLCGSLHVMCTVY